MFAFHKLCQFLESLRRVRGDEYLGYRPEAAYVPCPKDYHMFVSLEVVVVTVCVASGREKRSPNNKSGSYSQTTSGKMKSGPPTGQCE